MDVARFTALSQAFSPSAPIDQQALFAGRMTQLLDVLSAINQKGQHAILYGERGVGKTSLARVLSKSQIVVVDGRPITVAAINCDASMTFSSLWHRLFSEIAINVERQAPGFTGEVQSTHVRLNSLLPEKVGPDDIRRLLSKVSRTLIVIDELDRLEDEAAPALLADTIKALSDHAVDTTLLLVGVADSVDGLIEQHLSIERALLQIRMPRMSRPELVEIIDKGLAKAAMVIADDAKNQIVTLSQGLPHYTHLLTQIAAQRVVQTDRIRVEKTDVRFAIDTALQKAQQSTQNTYQQATLSSRANMYKQVLLACALAQTDRLGSFAPADIRHPLSMIMKKRVEIAGFSKYLSAFCEDGRGPVLQRIGSAHRYRFRFVNPLMQPFVIMCGLKDKHLPQGLA